ncbi:MAG TPA: hypothetical protein PK772_05565 [Chitinophagaceae bacterium]|nr:hypothetical protein [Chitinophagaceae bacterium]
MYKNRIHNEIFEIANNTKFSLQERVQKLIYYYQVNRGYGDRESELDFFKHFFQQIYNQYPRFLSIEWYQYQVYNDNYLFFDLNNLRINQCIDPGINFDFWDDEEDYNYEFCDAEFYLDGNNRDIIKLINTTQAKYSYLRPATDAILVFLKACYDFYKPFYFIYLFGRRAHVQITQEGISTNAEDIKYDNGNSYDKMNEE